MATVDQTQLERAALTAGWTGLEWGAWPYACIDSDDHTTCTSVAKMKLFGTPPEEERDSTCVLVIFDH